MRSLFITMSVFCSVIAGPRGAALADETRPADKTPPELNAKDKLIVETVLRLKEFDIEASPPAKAAILRYLRAQPGTSQYFELIERFRPEEIADELADFSLNHATETSGVQGATLLFAMGREAALQAAITHDDIQKAVAAITLIGHAGGPSAAKLLGPLVTSSTEPLTLRTAAVTATGRSTHGQQFLLKLAVEGRLSADLSFVTANVLLSSTDDAIRREAARYLRLPATADNQPLPPVAELAQRQGNADAGRIVFRNQGKCIDCHKIAGEGRAVGPDLSEIGDKLSREALYVSVLDPSAAISHNFESYALVKDDGLIVVGLLVSDTDEAVTLRTQEGIDKTIQKTAVEEFQKLKVSLMPQGLQKQMTVEQLVNLIEYTATLRKSNATQESQ